MARPDWMLDGKIFCEECGCRHDLDGCGKPECKHCYAQTVKVEVPADVDWYIVDYDGQEHVAEKHRTWH
jgi:hypothetical protein